MNLVDTIKLQTFESDVPGDVVAEDLIQAQKENQEKKNPNLPCINPAKPFEEELSLLEDGDSKKLKLVALIGTSTMPPETANDVEVVVMREPPLPRIRINPVNPFESFGDVETKPKPAGGLGGILPVPLSQGGGNAPPHETGEKPSIQGRITPFASEKIPNLKDKSFAELQDMAKQLIPTMSGELAYHPGSRGFGTNQNKETINRNTASLILIKASQGFDKTRINDPQYNQQITNEVGDMIGKMNLNETEQLKMISSIASTLEQNYNYERSSLRDSDSRYMGSQLYGLYQPEDGGNNRSYGGVCQDISFVSCQLYERLNPEKECLTMTTATGKAYHSVMMVSNKGTKDYTILDYGITNKSAGENFMQMRGRINTGMNIRLSKNNNGVNEEIAVVKNEYGQWIADATSVAGKTGNSLVRDLDGKINRLTQQFVHSFLSQEEQDDGNTFEVRAREGKLSSGENVTAVYAVIDQQRPNSKLHISVGGIETSSNETKSLSIGNSTVRRDSQEDRESIHINASASLGGEHKHNTPNGSRLAVYHYTGAYVNLQLSKTGTTDRYYVADKPYTEVAEDQVIGIDGNIGLSNTLGAKVENPASGTTLKLEGQVQHELVITDESKLYNLSNDIGGLLGNISFIPNRIEARAEVEQRINSQITAVGKGQYLGTNVGQNVLAEAGINIQNPDGMKYYVLTGYGARLSGFKTKQNYTPDNQNQGAILKAGVATPKGDSFDARLNIDPQNAANSSLSLSGRIALDAPPAKRSAASSSSASKVLYRRHPSQAGKVLAFSKFNGVSSWRTLDEDKVAENLRPDSEPHTPYRHHLTDENKVEVLNPMTNKWEETNKSSVPAELLPQGSPNFSRYSFFAHPQDSSKVLYFSLKNGKAKWTVMSATEVKEKHRPGPSSQSVNPYRKTGNGKVEAYNPFTKKWEPADSEAISPELISP